MPFRVGVDQDLDAGKFPVKARFDLVHDPMSFPHGHLRADPDVKLRKVMHPAGPGAQIMDAAYTGMMSCRLNEKLPPFQRPFLEIGRATSELQSLKRTTYAVFCVKKQQQTQTIHTSQHYLLNHH